MPLVCAVYYCSTLYLVAFTAGIFKNIPQTKCKLIGVLETCSWLMPLNVHSLHFNGTYLWSFISVGIQNTHFSPVSCIDLHFSSPFFPVKVREEMNSTWVYWCFTWVSKTSTVGQMFFCSNNCSLHSYAYLWTRYISSVKG